MENRPRGNGNIAADRPVAIRKQIQKAVKTRASRDELKRLVDKVVNHEKNAAEHRGDKEAMAYARELTS